MKKRLTVWSVLLVACVAAATMAFAPVASASTYLYSKSTTASVVLVPGEGGGSGIFKVYYDVYDDKVVFTSCYLQNCVNNPGFIAELQGAIYNSAGRPIYISPTRWTCGNFAKYWFSPYVSTSYSSGYVKIYWVGSNFTGQRSWSR